MSTILAGPHPVFTLRHFVWFAVVAAVVVIAADFRLHWDEPAALFTAAHVPFADIAADRYQPTGIAGFHSARLAHLLWIKLLTATIGPGWPTIHIAVVVSYALALLLALVLIHRLVVGLCPEADRKNAGLAVAVTALAPVFLYLLGKTLPEAPALLAAVVACLALLAAARPDAGRYAAAGWGLVIAACLLVIVFSKNVLVLSYVAFFLALLLCPRPAVDRRRLVVAFGASGLLSLLFFAVVLHQAEIPLGLYLGLFSAVAGEQEPLVSKILQVSMTAGLLYLALPLSLLSPRRRDAHFFLTWFALATLPQAALLESIESRYLLPSLPPLAGLVWISLDRLCLWWRKKTHRAPWRTHAAVATVLVSLAATAALAQMLMPNEVRMDQMHKVVRWLKSQPGQVAVLCPWEYTDFHYLRFAYPELAVYSVFSPELDEKEFAGFKQPARAAWLGDALVRNHDDLRKLGDRKLFYVGFHESFPVQELREITAFLPASWRGKMETQLARMSLLDQASMSWMWRDPAIRLDRVREIGHYAVYAVGRKKTATD